MNPNVTEEWRMNVPTKKYGEFILADLQKIAEQIVDERRAKKQSMIIQIAAIKVDKFKELNNTIRFCVDPINNVYYGMATGLLPDGNIKWRGIIMNEMNTYNLNQLNDALTYAVLRMHPKIEGSPYPLEEPVFRVVDQDAIAAAKNYKYAMAGKAGHIAKTMKKELILYFARYLGHNFTIDVSPVIVRAALFEHAYEDPFDFMEKYDNPNRQYYELFKSGFTVGAITHDYDKGYRFKSIPLGVTENEVVKKLAADLQVLDAVKSEVNRRDAAYKNMMKDTEVEPGTNPENSEELRKQLDQEILPPTDPNDY